MLPYLLKWKKVYDAIYWFPSETCSSKRTSTFADSTNEILYRKKTLEPQAVPKVTLQCKFARDRSGGSTDTTEAKLFRSIDVPREHSLQSLGSARGDQGVSQAERPDAKGSQVDTQNRSVCPGLSQQGEVDGEVAEQQQTRSTSP